MALLAMWGFDDAIAEDKIGVGGGGAGRLFGLAARINGTTALADLSATPRDTLVAGIGVLTESQVFGQGTFIDFRESGSRHIYLQIDTQNLMRMYRGDGTLIATSATSVFTVGLAIPWRYFEIEIKVADAGGYVNVYMAETLFMSYSGDTRNGGTGVINQIGIGGINLSGTNSPRYDDLYVLDTTGAAPYNARLGDVAITTLLPNGNGSSSGWVGSDSDSVNNYLLVDDPSPASMSDYVSSLTSGVIDLYTMQDVPLGYNVLAVQEQIYTQKSDTGTPPTVIPVQKGILGTVREDSPFAALSTTALMQASPNIQITDPDGNPWTRTRVNAIEVGVKIQ